MGALYFFLIVGLVAICLIWLTRKPGREGRTNVKPLRDKPRYHHTTGHHSLLHSHAHVNSGESGDVWKSRRRDTIKEQWGSYTIAASKIRFDDEIETEKEQEQESTDMTMTAIEYTSEESTQKRTSTAKR